MYNVQPVSTKRVHTMHRILNNFLKENTYFYHYCQEIILHVVFKIELNCKCSKVWAVKFTINHQEIMKIITVRDSISHDFDGTEELLIRSILFHNNATLPSSTRLKLYPRDH